jgi:transposase
MPMFLYARPATDEVEEQKVRKLAGARHAPADWIQRAKIITLSWAGLHTTAIATRLGCHAKTARQWLHRFNAAGLDGLGDRPIPGRPRRLSEHERGRIIALARSNPPGRAQRMPDGDLHTADEAGPPQWTLNSLTEAARAEGIDVHRSQVRRILLAEKVRWLHTHSWARSEDPDFASKRAAVVELYTHPPARTTVICANELGPVIPRTFAPAPGWSPDGHRIKAPLEYSRGSDKTWSSAGCVSATVPRSPSAPRRVTATAG